MDVGFGREGRDFVITLSGSMTFRDFQSSDDLLGRIDEALSGGSPPALVAFELGKVDMVDSHWLGAFVRALRRCEEHGVPIALRHAQPAVTRLFKLVQFERVFRIEP